MKTLTKRTKIILASIIGAVFVVALVLTGFVLHSTVYKSGEPVLYNMGLSLETADIKGFCGFGMEDVRLRLPNGNYQLQPCFKWYVSENTDVLAPCDGIIKIIEWQEQSGDYSVVIEPKVKPVFIFGNDWIINLDHVKDITVKKGDKITAGQVIGKPGSNQGASWMFELDLVRHSDGNHYAPGKFFDPSVKTVIEEKLMSIMKGFEGNSVNGQTLTYNYAAMLYPGCWMEKIPESVYQPGGQYYPGYPDGHASSITKLASRNQALIAELV